MFERKDVKTSILILALFMSGWVSIGITPTSYTDIANDSHELSIGETFDTKIHAPLVYYKRTEHLIREKGSSGVTTAIDTKTGEKVEKRISEAISQKLERVGLVHSTSNPKYRATYTVMDRRQSGYDSTRSNVVIRIHIKELNTDKTIFDRTGRYTINERFSGTVITNVVEDVMMTLEAIEKRSNEASPTAPVASPLR